MPFKAEMLAWPPEISFTVFFLLQVPPDKVDTDLVAGSPAPTSYLLSSGIFLPGSPQCVFDLQSHLINRKAGHPDSIPAAWDQL